MSKPVVPVILLMFLMFSCGKSSESVEDNNQPPLSLLVKDTIQVDYAGMLSLQDIDTEQERLLLYDQQRQIFLVTDFNGTVLNQIDKGEDTKGSYSFLLGPARFHDYDHLFIIERNGMMRFNFGGELVSHVPFSNEDPPRFSGRAMFAEEFLPYEGRYLGKGVFGRGEFGKNEREYYDEFLLLSWFNPEDGRFERFLRLQPESLFKNGKAYEVTEMMPSYALLNDTIYVIVGTDPYLEVYAAQEPYPLISRKKLNYEPYYPSEGQDMRSADPQAIRVIESSGFTKNLKASPEYLISGYSPGYDPIDRDRYSDPSIAPQDFRKSIEGKYPEYIHIMDHQGNRLLNEENHLNIDLREFTVREGEIWAKRRPSDDVEEDFVIIYRIAIE